MSALVENQTFSKVLEGEKVKIYSEESLEADNKEREAKGEDAIEPLGTQTFAFHTVSEETPLEDLQGLVQEADKQAAIINRGIVLYQQQFRNRLMGDKEWVPSEGIFDLSVALTAIGTRKAAPRKDISEVLGGMDAEKIAAILANLPEDKLSAIFAKLG